MPQVTRCWCLASALGGITSSPPHLANRPLPTTWERSFVPLGFHLIHHVTSQQTSDFDISKQCDNIISALCTKNRFEMQTFTRLTRFLTRADPSYQSAFFLSLFSRSQASPNAFTSALTYSILSRAPGQGFLPRPMSNSRYAAGTSGPSIKRL